MRKQVSIFVAGAKALVNERNALKALSHELNTKYNEDGVDVFVEMKTYEEFKDNQQVYNEYIVNVADIAIFVLDGCIGDKTKDELIKAVEAYKNKQLPEIIVFLKHYDEETSEIGQVLDLLETLFGQDYYYVEYSDMDDLKTQTRTRIERIIHPVQHIQGLKKSRWTIVLLSAAVLILAGLLGWQTLREKDMVTKADNEPFFSSDTPVLLFAGGGSASSFLKEVYGIDIDTVENSLFARMPSGNAWTLLTEEIHVMNAGFKKFIPICLSADSANETAFTKRFDDKNVFCQKARVIAFRVGFEPLTIYAKNGVWPADTISTDELEVLLNKIIKKEKDIDVYRTDNNSGTLRMYKRLCKVDFSGFSEYTEHTDPNILKDKPYMVLGSKYFKIEKLSPNSYKPLLIKTPDGKLVERPIFIYFNALKTDSEDAERTIPTPVLKFMHNFVKTDSDTIWWNDIKDGIIEANEPSQVIYQLNP